VPPVPRSSRLVALLIALALAASACSGGSDAATGSPTPSAASPISEASAASPEATNTVETTGTVEAAATPTLGATSTASPGPAAASARHADVGNVLAHIDVLAGDIGIRAAGTEPERDAAEYIAGVLEEDGYDTSIEPFDISTRIDGSSLTVEGTDVEVRPFMMNGSAAAEATGPLIYGALGSTTDLASLDVEGKVLLLDRGVVTFADKARNAQLAGAVAVVVANNETGPFGGNLGSRPATIPVVSITQAEGELLRPLAQDGATATVRAAIDTIQGESQNVVGRAGDTCRFYIGGHYDSVPEGPGANDNASGTSLMLELARVHRTDGLCVIAFGSEEIGLFGSQAYVASHDLTDALFMLNFDMAGRIDDPLVIGDATLQGLVLGASEGSPIRAGDFPRFASSDHVNFLNAGIPAVTITSGDDPFIHTSRDDLDNVSADSLATMLDIGNRSLVAALAAAG
jgi:aminopeptidase YwaD